MNIRPVTQVTRIHDVRTSGAPAVLLTCTYN
jgi:hypothetical protein